MEVEPTGAGVRQAELLRQALWSTKDELKAYADTITALLDDPDDAVRRAALVAAVKLEPDVLAPHTDAIAASLKDSDADVRACAVAVACKLWPFAGDRTSSAMLKGRVRLAFCKLAAGLAAPEPSVQAELEAVDAELRDLPQQVLSDARVLSFAQEHGVSEESCRQMVKQYCDLDTLARDLAHKCDLRAASATPGGPVVQHDKRRADDSTSDTSDEGPFESSTTHAQTQREVAKALEPCIQAKIELDRPGQQQGHRQDLVCDLLEATKTFLWDLDGIMSNCRGLDHRCDSFEDAMGKYEPDDYNPEEMAQFTSFSEDKFERLMYGPEGPDLSELLNEVNDIIELASRFTSTDAVRCFRT